MKRRKARSSGGTSSGADAAAEVPAVEWGWLLSRAMASLDEQGLERQAKREAAAERIKARMAKRGVKVGYDLDGVRRALAAYYSDVILSDRPKGFRKVFAEAGVMPSDFFDARETYPEFRLVYEYIYGRIKEVVATEAAEDVRQAQASQRRLVTEEGCELNQRAVELSLKATMKDVYGDGGGSCGGGEADAKKAISYSFPNMTINWLVAPKEVPKQVEIRPVDGSEVIDA